MEEKHTTPTVNIQEVLKKEYLPRIDAILEVWIPKQFEKSSLEKLLKGKQRYEADIVGINKSISEPIWEMLDRGY